MEVLFLLHLLLRGIIFLAFFVVVFYINGSSCPKGGDGPLALCSIRSPLRRLTSLGVLFGRLTGGRISCWKAIQQSVVKGLYSQTEKGLNVTVY